MNVDVHTRLRESQLWELNREIGEAQAALDHPSRPLAFRISGIAIAILASCSIYSALPGIQLTRCLISIIPIAPIARLYFGNASSDEERAEKARIRLPDLLHRREKLVTDSASNS